MTAPTPPQTPQAAPTAPAVPPVSTAPPSGPQAELTEAQAATMSEWVKQDLAAGKLTPEQADKAFNELGRTPAQRLPDQRTDEQKMLDKQFPQAKESDYTIRYGEPGQEMLMTPELKQFDQSARTWMTSAGLPRELGNSLVNAIAKVAQTTKAMTPDQLETYGVNEFQKLQRAHGPALDEKLQAVDRMVQVIEAKQPGLVRLLKSKGIFDSALVASLLIQQAQIFHARRG